MRKTQDLRYTDRCFPGANLEPAQKGRKRSNTPHKTDGRLGGRFLLSWGDA